MTSRRDGVTNNGEQARMFGAACDDVDHKVVAERCEDDRVISGSLSRLMMRPNFPT
jgi:hypothetical protein